jgi:hypothetical protein
MFSGAFRKSTKRAAAAVALSAFAQAAMALPTYVTCGAPPWGEVTNESAMDNVYGAGNWTAADFATVNTAALFNNATTPLIFMDGSDGCATELDAFLTANGAALSTWVNAGGRLLLNSAPNEGADFSMGFGVTLNYGGADNAGTVTAAVPGHPIFNGPYLPAGTNFTGGSFSHARVTGPGTVLITGDSGDAPPNVLLEQTVGAGRILFGGMTTTNFHAPAPNAQNLRQNMLAYLFAGAAQQVPTLSEWGVILLSAFLGLAVLFASRRKLTPAA